MPAFPRQRNPLYRVVPLRITCPPTRKEKVLSTPFSARRSDAGRRAPYPCSFVPLMLNRSLPRRTVQSESDLYKQIRGGYCFILMKHNLQTALRRIVRPRSVSSAFFSQSFLLYEDIPVHVNESITFLLHAVTTYRATR